MDKPNKSLARKKFLNKRVIELKGKEQLIYLQAKMFLKNFIDIDSSDKKLYIGIYWPLLGEVDLRSFKKDLDLEFALPCTTKKGNIQYREWGLGPLKKDFYGIPSPLEGTLLKPKDISVIFVPAIAIDKLGNRLGYGSGCFDRLRKDKEWKSIPSFVVLPDACVSESPFPIDIWDIPFDGWITENRETIRKYE